MYFDIKPKEKREDLFDREEELNKLIKYINVGSRVIILTGFRRSGKTSLLKVGLNLLNKPYILVDARGISINPSLRDLYILLESGINDLINRSKHLVEKLLSSLSMVNGISIHGLSVYFKWRGKNKLLLHQLFDNLNYFAEMKIKDKVIIAFDEAQYLKGVIGKYLLSAIAHAYDYNENLIFIFTGSQVGLLHDFLGVDNPKSYLYGRHMSEIKLGNFSKNLSLEFLREGFKQINLEVPEEILEYAYNCLDGIVGWLTEFGYRAYEAGNVSKEIVDQVVEIGAKLVREEFQKFIEYRGEARSRYEAILKAIAIGKNTWSQIKQYLEEIEGSHIPDISLKRLLDTLIKASYIEKQVDGRNITYKITDPLLRETYKI